MADGTVGDDVVVPREANAFPYSPLIPADTSLRKSYGSASGRHYSPWFVAAVYDR